MISARELLHKNSWLIAFSRMEWSNSAMQRIFAVSAVALLFFSVVSHAAPSINIQKQPTGARLSAQGGGSGHVIFEGTANAGSDWELLSMLPTADAQAGWVHSKSTILPWQFYRARWQTDYEAPLADNFRLIDHQNRSREMFYYLTSTNVKGFVFIFTGNGCASVRQYIPTLNAQRAYFASRGVIYWMIDSNLEDNRSNIDFYSYRKVNASIAVE